MDNEDYSKTLREMISGFFKVMLLASETEVDGERAAFVNSQIAVDAILHLLAAIIEGSPEVETRKNIRAATEKFERRLRLSVELLRKEYVETGRRVMPTFRAAS